MKKLLLTGFEPFLDHGINPTQKIVEALDKKEIGGYFVEGRVLPVDFIQSAKKLLNYFDEVGPDAVIMLGLAAGRRNVTPERVAINCNDGARDNNGFTPEDQPIDANGPAAYFSTLPIRKFVDQLKNTGYPAEISNTAGTYLCNNVMYSMLHHLNKTNRTIPAGFVHIPASHELAAAETKLPSWSSHDLIDSIKILIQSIEG